MKYSQIGQDVFVLNVLKGIEEGVFVDIGCQKPDEINNTILLEEMGWSGLSIDIVDYSAEWNSRRTPFIQTDALTCDYPSLFKKYNIPTVVDYLSIDLEGEGYRYKALEKVMKTGYRFKIITIEHDLYRGYELTEQIPQRKLLGAFGYTLVASNVAENAYIMEDWWVHPHLVPPENYAPFLAHNKSFVEIFKQANINLNDYY